ncbi:hypothetical protein PVAP13_9NG746577 [Panicum virgatum]|uniref:Uncharacterized protein n=1 Tax=Panicum virgatum TaxID=38727 RepID=A0A8T0N3J0_PANVG|nr:hypothetical protein PVAP13_9NG746577 [Panicum virgatum]
MCACSLLTVTNHAGNMRKDHGDELGASQRRTPAARRLVALDEAPAPRVAQANGSPAREDRGDLARPATTHVDPGRRRLIERSGKAKRWTVFHLPSTPGREIKYRPPQSSASLGRTQLMEAPAGAGSRSASPAIGATCSRTLQGCRARQWRRRGAPARLTGPCRPAWRATGSCVCVACVARDASALRRRKGALRRGRRSDGSGRLALSVFAARDARSPPTMHGNGLFDEAA